MITGMRARLAPRPPPLRRPQADPARAGRHGHGDRQHLGRRDDRPRGEARRASAARSSPTSGEHAMSRIGRKPIPVPDGVTVDIAPAASRSRARRASSPERLAGHEGRAGRRHRSPSSRPTDRGEHRALHGLTRSLIANMVEGVTEGFEKRLEIQGVGYRAQLQGKALELALGYSHPVSIEAPEGIEFEVPQPTQVVVRGIDKQLVGEIAAHIRSAARRSPTRARASATRASTSPQGREARMTVVTKRAAPPAPPPPRAREGPRHRRAPAPVRLSLQPRRVRPADRRRRSGTPSPPSPGPSRSCAS